MLTWLLLRRVRVCRILVPEGTATRRNIPVEGSGSSDALLLYAWASWLSPIDDAHVASSSTSTSGHVELWERSDHATCEWSLLLTVDWVSTVGDWALCGLQLICIAMEDSADSAWWRIDKMEKMVHHFAARCDKPTAVQPPPWKNTPFSRQSESETSSFSSQKNEVWLTAKQCEYRLCVNAWAY